MIYIHNIRNKTKRRRVNVRSELDRYLEDDPLPEDNQFDVLAFWKVNVTYPTLRVIAKDLLAIPVSTVASESDFSTGGRIISPHRSRLHAKTVEALMCLRSWMMGDYTRKFLFPHLYHIPSILC